MHDRMGGVSSCCQKMAELLGERGSVGSQYGLQGDIRDSGREGSVASYRELPEGVCDEGGGRGYR